MTLISSRQKSAPVSTSIALHGIRWPTYKAILADVGDDRPWKIAYNGGILEIRIPRSEHEESKRMLEDFVTTVVDELAIEARSLGSLTLEREELSRAIEPDSCFYIQNERSIRGKTVDLSVDPPPDRVIESDCTNSSLNKHSIYAALGVHEIWRYRSPQLEIYLLTDDAYICSNISRVFPFLPIEEVSNFIENSPRIGQRTVVRQFRSRIRQILRDREH